MSSLDDVRYAAAAGLTWGTASLHILEVLMVATGQIPYSTKVYIAISGATVYTLSTIVLALRKKAGAWLIILFPAIGALAVVLGYVLELGVHPDLFNLVILGVQIPGIVLAGALLGWWGRKG